jgi:hypothetical protein
MTPMEQRLARRIHNQRVALRQNWEIVEMRADERQKRPLMPRLLKSALKHSAEAREAKATLTTLILMLCALEAKP